MPWESSLLLEGGGGGGGGGGNLKNVADLLGGPEVSVGAVPWVELGRGNGGGGA